MRRGQQTGRGILVVSAPSIQRRLSHGVLVGLLAVAVGQALQVLLGPYSRLQGTYIRRSGIAALSPDSSYYLNNSVAFSSIAESPWTNWSYLTVGRLAHLAGDAATILVALQLLVAVGVSAALYVVVQKIAGVAAGWTAAAAFGVNPLVAQWFRFVQTETLFFACVIVLVLLSARLPSHPSRAGNFILLLIGIFAAFMRPNGVLVLLSTLALMSLHSLSRRRALGAIAGLALMAPVLLGLGHLATGDPAEGSLVSQLYSGVVIEGTPEAQLLLSMPQPLDSADESISAALNFVANHPVAAARLFLTRIAVEISQMRPHYPTVVNWAALATISAYFATAIIGFRDPRSASLRRPAVVVMFPILALIGLTFAVPEARYGWGALVALAPFVGIGVARLIGSGRSSLSAPSSTP